MKADLSQVDNYSLYIELPKPYKSVKKTISAIKPPINWASLCKNSIELKKLKSICNKLAECLNIQKGSSLNFKLELYIMRAISKTHFVFRLRDNRDYGWGNDKSRIKCIKLDKNQSINFSGNSENLFAIIA